MTRFVISISLCLVTGLACGKPGPDAAQEGKASPSPPRATVDKSLAPDEPLAGPKSRAVDPPAAPGAMAPNMTATSDSVLMVWLEPEPGPVRLRLSAFREGAWSEPVTVAQSAEILANWADTPSVVRSGDGALVVHWPEKAAAGGHAYDVQLARSTDDGATWSKLGRLHQDRTAGEHGFVSLIPTKTSVRAFWLEGQHARAGATPATELHTAIVGEAISGEAVVDERVCDCCGTSAALLRDRALIVYRDRSAAEIRDISLVRQIEPGWSAPLPVHADNWNVTGCPVNGPAIETRDEAAAVAWYTYADARPVVRVAFASTDEARFGAPIDVDAPRDRNAPIGRVDLVYSEEDEAFISWLASEREQARILIRRVRTDGKRGRVHQVTTTRAGRNSGFPRMVDWGDQLMISWTEAAEPSVLHAKLVPKSLIPAAADPKVESEPRSQPTAVQDPKLAVGGSMPTYAATDLAGQPVELASLRGKPIFVNVWATWCEPCRREFPRLLDLAERWNERGLELVAISVDTPDALKSRTRLVKRLSSKYRVWSDPEDRASSVFGLGALPASFLFDGGGILRWRRDGAISSAEPELREILENALPVPSTRVPRSRGRPGRSP